MKYDPLYLFENKRSRFDKFVKRAIARAGGAAESSEEEPAPIKEKKSSKREQRATGMTKAPAAAPVR